MKDVSLKSSRATRFHVYGILPETQYSDRAQISAPRGWWWREGVSIKRKREGLGEGGDGTVLGPDGGGSYTNLHMC